MWPTCWLRVGMRSLWRTVYREPRGSTQYHDRGFRSNGHSYTLLRLHVHRRGGQRTESQPSQPERAHSEGHCHLHVPSLLPSQASDPQTGATCEVAPTTFVTPRDKRWCILQTHHLAELCYCCCCGRESGPSHHSQDALRVSAGDKPAQTTADTPHRSSGPHARPRPVS